MQQPRLASSSVPAHSSLQVSFSSGEQIHFLFIQINLRWEFWFLKAEAFKGFLRFMQHSGATQTCVDSARRIYFVSPRGRERAAQICVSAIYTFVQVLCSWILQFRFCTSIISWIFLFVFNVCVDICSKLWFQCVHSEASAISIPRPSLLIRDEIIDNII